MGVGSIVLLPAVQLVIESSGWRTACWTMGLLALVVLAPINLLLRKRPEDMGLQPDGDAAPEPRQRATAVQRRRPGLGGDRLDARRAPCGPPASGGSRSAISAALYAWYAVQVHQTKYLIEIGFSPTVAAWALGLVSLAGIPGQIALGHISDRIGREWVWTAGALGLRRLLPGPAAAAGVSRARRCSTSWSPRRARSATA